MRSNKSFPILKDRTVSLLLKTPKAIFIYLFLGWAAGHLGMLHWRFELATHFQIQYSVASFVFALLFALIKQWKWMSVAFLLASISCFSVLPWFFASKPAASQAKTGRIRLLLSNVLYTNRNHDALLDLVRAVNPDLLFVQEVTPEWAKALEKIRDLYPNGIIEEADLAGGIGAISRIPLVKIGDAGLNNYNGPSLELTLQVSGRLVHILTPHPPPPMDEKRLHSRNVLFNEIAARARSWPDPKIVIGDLNCTMWSPYYKQFIEQSGLANVREGFGVLASWPTWLPFMKIPIDHCLVSRDIQVINVQLGPNIGSDHLPLVVDLAIPTSY